MTTYKVRLRAVIDDEVEIEAESEEEAVELAGQDWRFVEAQQWEVEVVDCDGGGS